MAWSNHLDVEVPQRRAHGLPITIEHNIVHLVVGTRDGVVATLAAVLTDHGGAVAAQPAEA